MKAQTVQITSDLSLVPSNVAIHNHNLKFRVNSSWVSYSNTPNINQDSLNVKEIVGKLELFGRKTISITQDDSIIPFAIRPETLIIDKITYNTTFPSKFGDLPRETPEIRDYQELLTRSAKILSHNYDLNTNHGKSHVAVFNRRVESKFLKVSIAYSLKSEINTKGIDSTRITSFIVNPNDIITKVSKNFIIKISGNRLRVLKSNEVYQVFIRSINNIN